MSTHKNVYRIDAADVEGGMLIPKDIEGEVDAYELNRSVKSDWAIKVVNDTDADVDATALVSTSDDSAFEAYAEDGAPETASTGDAPDNVVYITGETVAGYLGAELAADPAPTSGTVTVVFNSRLYGGA
ncbi:hypothetical protein [Natronoglomus mannanivorans]|uniref:Uncharacterized protein n=1 Tax=Natronoglomus mannanivorans TaxID=2979990 RepID=A0AAP2Z1D9_9EURY|nr:hypothetical protein [Halobacteria archaeon AArc-xg1-1]